MTDGNGSSPEAADEGELLRESRNVNRWQAAGAPTERSKDFGMTVGRLRRLFGTENPTLVAVVLMAVVGTVLNVLGPRVLGTATNLVIQGLVADGIDFGALHRTLLEAVALYLGSYVLGLGTSYLLAGVVQRLMYRLREAAEAKINALPLAYIDRQARGDLLSRVTNDIDNVAQSLQQTMSQMLTSILLIVGVMVMMFTISPLLAAVALVTVPVAVYSMKVIGGKARPRYIAQWRHTGQLNAHVEETFTGHAIVKAFGRQAASEEQFRQTNDAVHDASFGAQFLSSLMQPATMFLGNLQYVLVAAIGGVRVASGAITVGDVQAFIQYSRSFTMPLTQLATLMNTFQSGIASLERVLEFLDADEQSTDLPLLAGGSAVATPVRGRVEFRDVTFSYRTDKPLIEGLSLVAEPGQTVAIVGPTGAGKTTLVNLLMRFYELDGGAILLDGVDVATLPRDQLRSQIGMVLQDTWLFGGTIFDNIAYGRPGASREEVLEAARATYVDRFVHSLPLGYETVINDEGDNISAGQRQLVTIARAFLADRSILVLDEATSSVDTRTEVQIQQAMNRLRANRTSFVIAHRLSTIRGADTILVMEDGRIVEQGSHHELLARDGAYHALYSAQFAGAAANEVG